MITNFDEFVLNEEGEAAPAADAPASGGLAAIPPLGNPNPGTMDTTGSGDTWKPVGALKPAEAKQIQKESTTKDKPAKVVKNAVKKKKTNLFKNFNDFIKMKNTYEPKN